MSDIKVEFSNVFVSEIGIWVAVMAAPFECLEGPFFATFIATYQKYL